MGKGSEKGIWPREEIAQKGETDFSDFSIVVPMGIVNISHLHLQLAS